MKVEELHLIAFGPFTDLRLDLSGGHEGLHVIFGENEAGKSSALRALVDFLYEIPNQTTDAFVHPYSQLRIGGRLKLAKGERLSFVRRKGYKATLRSPETDEPLEEGLLDGALRGVDRLFFTSFFGIDQPTLVKGGEQILAQGGDVGQALFTAALPTGDLHATLSSLDEEASQLFKRNATKPTINEALAAHRQAKREVQEFSLAASEWIKHHRALEEAKGELDRVGAELGERLARQSRLTRLTRVIPLLSSSRELSAELQRTPAETALPEDTALRRREAQEAKRGAAEAQARALVKRTRLLAELEALSIPAGILDEADAIEALYQRLGSFKQAQQDRPGLLARADQRRRDAEQELRALGRGLTLADLERIRAVVARQRSIQALANQHQALEAAVELARETLERHQSQLHRTTESIHALKVGGDGEALASLRRLVASVRQAGDLDQSLSEAKAEARRLDEESVLAVVRLPLIKGTPEELVQLPLPSRDAIERFEGHFVELREQRRELSLATAKGRRALGEVERRLGELRAVTGDLPSEEALQAAREKRAEVVAELRLTLDRPWVEPRTALVDELAGEIQRADDLADRLRREADRVQQHATLTSRREELLQELDYLGVTGEAHKGEAEGLERAWNKLWSVTGLEPLAPREMSAWLTAFERLRELLASLRTATFRRQDIEAAREQGRARLLTALEQLDERLESSWEELGPLLSHAEELIARTQREQARREELKDRLAQLEGDFTRAQEQLRRALEDRARWRGRWAEAISEVGLGAESEPIEVEEVLEILAAALAKLDQSLELERRAAGIDRDAETFQAEVRGFVECTAPELTLRDSEEAINVLHARLKHARQAAEAGSKLEAQLRETEEELVEAQSRLDSAQSRLEALMEQAGVAREEDLPDAEARSARRRGLLAELKRTEDLLRREGDGATLEELVQDAKGLDPDTIPGRLQSLRAELRTLEQRRDGIWELRGRHEAELARMDGNSRAAEAAERSQEILASLRCDVERYVRLRLASKILREHIERFRAENQSTLLRRSGELFARLTLGSFVGLQTEYDECGEPVMVGARSTSELLGVTAMSSGTRDQLYLALRLATLESYLQHAGEPMPFIVDDILINFDDRRSAATLEVLAEIASQTQVIAFTHHERVLQLASELASTHEIYVHDLRSAG